MIRKKVCMLGSYAVGKTSLVRRFVDSIFSDRYETTIGVRILKKKLVVADTEITLILWDMHGDDEFQEVRTRYLRGASGHLIVVDGTRADTLDKAFELEKLVQDNVADTPTLVLFNKSDLQSDWELDEATTRPLIESGSAMMTSAKSGEGVETAFRALTEKMLAR